MLICWTLSIDQVGIVQVIIEYGFGRRLNLSDFSLVFPSRSSIKDSQNVPSPKLRKLYE
jgi:hypothetical protein